MIQPFMDIVTTLENDAVTAWKQRGGKVMGYASVYIPEEIFHAAGLLPFRLRGMEAESTTIGDIYYGPVICSFPKCILHLAGEGRYRFLDGAVFTYECDHMRRLYDTWRMAARDYENILPEFFYYYGLPHKYESYSIDWFIEETALLKTALEEHLGTVITDEALTNSIRVYNEYRELSQRLETLRLREDIPISGAEATAVMIAATAMPKEDYNELLRDLLTKLEDHTSGLAGRKRLLLAGSVNDDPDFVGLIEASGGVVVADSLCFGSRCYTDPVDETLPPLEALAHRYLTHTCCPRMSGSYKDRRAFIEEKIIKYDLDGIILQNIRFCDMHGADNGLMERDLETAGIPALRLEREYGPLVEKGRLRMRLDGFMERITYALKTGKGG